MPIVLSPYAPKTYVGGAAPRTLSPYAATTYDNLDYSAFLSSLRLDIDDDYGIMREYEGNPATCKDSKDYSVERFIMNLVSKASELAMQKSNYLQDMQKWEKCPALFDIKAFGGKNAVGDFGENLVHEWHKQKGIASAIIKKGHDVHSGDKKIEVKTAFESRMGTFWFNQIYYTDPKTGVTKDWDCLIFVFVYPDRVELWEIERPENPEDHFNWNNGWSWQKKGSEKLDQNKWKLIDCLPTCELGE